MLNSPNPNAFFEFLGALPGKLASALKPPPWVVDELQNRLVLFLNHVLASEPQARNRLLRQSGRVVHIQWADIAIYLEATPAGLLAIAPPGKVADLTLTLTDTSPLTLARNTLQNGKPSVRIEGDVQLAAEVNWLVDHVRWDATDDLARLIGDAPAHALSQAAARAAQVLRGWLPAGARATAPSATTSGDTNAKAPAA